jgi:putative N6-adenine-specific DNA methylase
MKNVTLIAPCHFGLEAVLKREISDLGYKIVQVEDGRVSFEGDITAICRANIFLRTAERILLKVGEFQAETFDQLFEEIKALPWEEFIPEKGKFWVAKAASIKSKLFSPSDIQSIVKKAVVERLKNHYKVSWFEESGEQYPIRIFIFKDKVTVSLDTSGDSLHKRGYRLAGGKAPISETLAAALILLSPWTGERILVDPFCGSGTFPIEAAMIAAKIAPGMSRDFLGRAWENFMPIQHWFDAYEEAESMVNTEIFTDIQGYDLDEEVVAYARENAKRAGVDMLIHFQQRNVQALSHPRKYGFIITNPPYGERLEEKELLPALYGELGQAMRRLDTWSTFLISSYEDAEKYIGRKADKNRKVYNGMIQARYYQFMGPKPPTERFGRNNYCY